MLPVIAELLLTLACCIAAWLALREQQGWRALGFVSMGVAAFLAPRCWSNRIIWRACSPVRSACR